MQKEKRHIEPGTSQAPEKYKIVIADRGPYLVFGQPPLQQEFIVANGRVNILKYIPGLRFAMPDEPTALCRCGGSSRKPYCDGSHEKTSWEPELTADLSPIQEEAEQYEGPKIRMTDNENYCAFARFCDVGGRVWNLVEKGADEESAATAIEECNLCPGDRLRAWDKETGEPLEIHLDPSLGLIEDEPMSVSGPLWVKGGIPLDSETGIRFELRNKMALCRCGHSSNMPYCDGTHANVRFRDGLPGREK